MPKQNLRPPTINPSEWCNRSFRLWPERLQGRDRLRRICLESCDQIHLPDRFLVIHQHNLTFDCAEGNRAMIIQQGGPEDPEVLFEIWLRSVRAIHHFLTEEDIQSSVPLVQTYLSMPESEFWVLRSHAGTIMGFMGMAGNKIESLFLAPEFHRKGGGRQLIQHAQSLWGELTVDVNEQNEAARRFYEACGFIVEGRSELDSTGCPFPLLHMRLAASAN